MKTVTNPFFIMLIDKTEDIIRHDSFGVYKSSTTTTKGIGFMGWIISLCKINKSTEHVMWSKVVIMFLKEWSTLKVTRSQCVNINIIKCLL